MSGSRVLVVEDNPVNRRLAVDVLRAAGYEVVEVAGAPEARDRLAGSLPDCIVMDVRLGPISGMDLLEDYPRHMQDYHPRVVVITAYDDESAKKRAADLKVDAFLLKPFTKDVLLSTVFSSIENYYEGELKMVRLAKQAFQKKDAARQQTRDELNKKLKENGE